MSKALSNKKLLKCLGPKHFLTNSKFYIPKDRVESSKKCDVCKGSGAVIGASGNGIRCLDCYGTGNDNS